MLRFLVLSVALLFVTGCKLEVISLEGGEVQSVGSGTCLEQSTCVHSITDSNYSETFTAVATPPNVFVKWYGGDEFLCPNSTNPQCEVNFGRLSGSLTAEEVASAPDTYLMPIFKEVEGCNPVACPVPTSDGNGDGITTVQLFSASQCACVETTAFAFQLNLAVNGDCSTDLSQLGGSLNAELIQKLNAAINEDPDLTIERFNMHTIVETSGSVTISVRVVIPTDDSVTPTDAALVNGKVITALENGAIGYMAQIPGDCPIVSSQTDLY